MRQYCSQASVSHPRTRRRMLIIMHPAPRMGFKEAPSACLAPRVWVKSEVDAQNHQELLAFPALGVKGPLMGKPRALAIAGQDCGSPRAGSRRTPLPLALGLGHFLVSQISACCLLRKVSLLFRAISGGCPDSVRRGPVWTRNTE